MARRIPDLYRSICILTFAILSLRASGPSDQVRTGGSAKPARGGCELRILSWNIERGQQLAAVSDQIAQLNPNIAVLQELDVNANRTGRVNVPEELARKISANYIFAPEFIELGQGSEAYHGQSILTALTYHTPRPLRFQTQSDYWRPRWYMPNWAVLQRREGGRVALALEVEAGSGRLVVYNVHLESRGDEQLRLRQTQEIIQDIRRYPADAPILIAGDFNTRAPNPPAISALKEAGFRMAVGQAITTIHNTAIDWILVRGPISFHQPVIHNKVRASDHFPLTANIRLEGAACDSGTAK